MIAFTKGGISVIVSLIGASKTTFNVSGIIEAFGSYALRLRAENTSKVLVPIIVEYAFVITISFPTESVKSIKISEAKSKYIFN